MGSAREGVHAALIVLSLVVVAAAALRAARTHERAYEPTAEEREHQRALETLTALFGRSLGRRGIGWWPVGGTLLGAARDGGIIPYDDDVDVGVWAADLPRIRGALAEDYRGNLTMWKGSACWKVSPADRRTLVLDVFPSARGADGRVEFAEAGARESWPLEYFTAEEFGGGDRPYRFGRLTLRGAARPCTHLDRVYPGWDRRGCNTEHHSGSTLRKLRAALAPETYLYDPAQSRRVCA